MIGPNSCRVFVTRETILLQMLPRSGQPRNKRCHFSFLSLGINLTVCISSLAVGERTEDLPCQYT